MFSLSLFLFFGTVKDSQAANIYLGPTSTGTGQGDSWTNTKSFSSIGANQWIRGNTYYFKEGSYGSLTITTSNSGSSRIILKKCGADGQTSKGSGDGVCENASGFVASQHDGQAVFGSMNPQSGYITIDGATGGGPGGNVADADWNCVHCGFSFRGESTFGWSSAGSPLNPDGIILKHLEMDGLDDGSGDAGRTLELWYSNDILIQNSYIHDAKCDLLSGGSLSNVIFEYSKLARPHQIICHGDLLEHQVGDSSNITFRFNFFEDVVGSYGFGTHDPNISGYYIYGNIFYWTFRPTFGNHLIGELDAASGNISNLKFYNNSLSGPFVDDGNDITNVCVGNLHGGTGNEVRNNIWRSTESNPAYEYDCGMGGAANSGNTGYQINGLNQELFGNPFVSVPNNFNLVAASSPGTTLNSPYNTDMFGNIRGADGVWDRGALEYVSGSAGDTTAPASPGGLTVR